MYILGVDPTRLDATAKFGLGNVAIDNDGKKYRYVAIRNSSATVAGAVGDMVAWAAATGAGSNYVVTDNTDADTKPLGAGMLGVAVLGTASGTAEYCWIQTHGPATVNQTIAGSPADGDAVYLSTTDKTLTLATAADDPVCAYANDASAKTVVLACN